MERCFVQPSRDEQPTIWVDADSCPQRIREIIANAARRVSRYAVFVANRKIPFPRNAFTKMVVVSSAEGSADAYILAHSTSADIVVTRDIPHAADLVERGVAVVNDRGDTYTAENIRERLSVRNFMKGLRESGLSVPEHGSYGAKQIALFSAAFDRVLAIRLKASSDDG